MSILRLSDKLRSTGATMTVIGLIGVIAPFFIPTTNREQGAAACSGIGAAFIFIGLPILLFYYACYRVTPGSVLVDRRGRLELEGWHFGLPPAAPMVITTARRSLEIPSNGSLLELETPDEGVLGVSITVSYSPDLKNPEGLMNFVVSGGVDKAVDNRVRNALTRWTMAKPLPGTLKRAVSMQKEAESYLFGRLTGTSEHLNDDMTLYLEGGSPIVDFGIRVHEINILVWRPIKSGTGKPDWGDGDHVGFDAKLIFKQFHAHTDNLSNLRKLKEALLDSYPDEGDDIEDIYDAVRISMKENRER